MLNYSSCLFVFEKSHCQSIFSGCKRLVISDFIYSLKDEPQTLQCCHCHLYAQAHYLVYGEEKMPTYWFTNFWNTSTCRPKLSLILFISSYGIPKAALPCSPAFNACRKPQALPKAVSRAHCCSPLPVQAGQQELPGTTEQRLFGHCQAAWGLLAAGSGLPGELHRRKVDISGRRPRVRVKESDMSTVQAGNLC